MSPADPAARTGLKVLPATGISTVGVVSNRPCRPCLMELRTLSFAAATHPTHRSSQLMNCYALSLLSNLNQCISALLKMPLNIFVSLDWDLRWKLLISKPWQKNFLWTCRTRDYRSYKNHHKSSNKMSHAQGVWNWYSSLVCLSRCSPPHGIYRNCQFYTTIGQGWVSDGKCASAEHMCIGSPKVKPSHLIVAVAQGSANG